MVGSVVAILLVPPILVVTGFFVVKAFQNLKEGMTKRSLKTWVKLLLRRSVIGRLVLLGLLALRFLKKVDERFPPEDESVRWSQESKNKDKE